MDNLVMEQVFECDFEKLRMFDNADVNVTLDELKRYFNIEDEFFELEDTLQSYKVDVALNDEHTKIRLIAISDMSGEEMSELLCDLGLVQYTTFKIIDAPSLFFIDFEKHKLELLRLGTR